VRVPLKLYTDNSYRLQCEINNCNMPQRYTATHIYVGVWHAQCYLPSGTASDIPAFTGASQSWYSI